MPINKPSPQKTINVPDPTSLVTVSEPDLLKLAREEETTPAVRALRQHDYGLTVYSLEFSDGSEKPTGRELIGHDMVPPNAVEPIVRLTEVKWSAGPLGEGGFDEWPIAP